MELIEVRGGQKIYYQIGDSSLLFYGEELNNRPDFMIQSNCTLAEVKVLIFFDSRGISSNYSGSVAERIIQKLESQNTNYLLVSRPLEITTWMTLYNFLRLNALHPEKIITNMGFVDFTPKKKEVIYKSILQYDCFFSNRQADVHFVEWYIDSHGENIELFMQHYPGEFIKLLSAIFENIELLVFNTPLLAASYHFERLRPVAFFEGVRKSNALNHSLEGNTLVFDFAGFTNKETYDAVHYTNAGMEILYNSIKSYL